MTAKNTLLLTLTSAVISIALCMVYQKIYSDQLFLDFSSVLSPMAVIGACTIGALLLAWGNFFALKYVKKHGQVIYNLLVGILSFASIIGPLAQKLPLDVEFPEMFPGLAIPMHFFPVLAHLAVLPLFVGSRQ